VFYIIVGLFIVACCRNRGNLRFPPMTPIPSLVGFIINLSNIYTKSQTRQMLGTYGSQTSPPFLSGIYNTVCQYLTQNLKQDRYINTETFLRVPSIIPHKGVLWPPPPEHSADSLISVDLKHLCEILTDTL
jgi:hypothetical protein